MDDDKLKNLKHKINKFKEHLEPTKKAQEQNESTAFNIAVDLVAGVIVGVSVGIFLDKTLHSAPLFLLICLCFGILGSMKIIWSKYINKKNGS